MGTIPENQHQLKNFPEGKTPALIHFLEDFLEEDYLEDKVLIVNNSIIFVKTLIFMSL